MTAADRLTEMHRTVWNQGEVDRILAAERKAAVNDLVSAMERLFDDADREKDSNVGYYAEAYMIAKRTAEGMP